MTRSWGAAAAGALALITLALSSCSAFEPEAKPDPIARDCAILDEIIAANNEEVADLKDFLASHEYVGPAMNERRWAAFDRLADDLLVPSIEHELRPARNRLVDALREVASVGRLFTSDLDAGVTDWSAISGLPSWEERLEQRLLLATDEGYAAGFDLEQICDELSTTSG